MMLDRVSCIESPSLSVAWGRVFLRTSEPGSRTAPLVVSISGFSSELPDEDPEIRAALDRALSAQNKNSVRVSALTIFPYDLWCRRGQMPCDEFSRFCVERLLPRLKSRDPRNRLGTYFERMMAYGSKNGAHPINQLAFVIELLKNARRRPRQSALQMSCFDPTKDLTKQTRRGFPCLQQISVTHEADRRLALNAYYPTQYIFDRAYGNYLGLCHLGAFIAHQTGYRFARLNCFVGRPDLGAVSKKSLQSLVRTVQRIATQGSAAQGEKS